MAIFWGLFFLVLTLGGFYLMVTYPISKKYKSSIYLDIGMGTFFIVSALIYASFTYLGTSGDDENTDPCASHSPQAICYGLDTKTCENAWKSFDNDCEEEVRPIREKRPSALLYNVVYKCHAQKFDKITFYNRRKTDSPFCRQYFKKLGD
jgi:hypothetical protein